MSIGKVFICTAEIDSTNAWAARWVKEVNETAPDSALLHGMVLTARIQTAGRGQMGNVWLSQAGKDAMFSIVLLPRFLAATDQFYLNIAVSLAVHKALSPLVGDSLRIKWPNDIYVKDKKMGGILIENTLAGTHIAHSIVGIGINVNAEIDQQLLPRATSLKTVTGKEYDVTELIHAIAGEMNMYYEMLKRERYTEMKETYLSIIYKQGEEANFRVGENTFTANIYGITQAGKLLLQHTDGSVHSYGFKEVEWV